MLANHTPLASKPHTHINIIKLMSFTVLMFMIGLFYSEQFGEWRHIILAIVHRCLSIVKKIGYKTSTWMCSWIHSLHTKITICFTEVPCERLTLCCDMTFINFLGSNQQLRHLLKPFSLFSCLMLDIPTFPMYILIMLLNLSRVIFRYWQMLRKVQKMSNAQNVSSLSVSFQFVL